MRVGGGDHQIGDARLFRQHFPDVHYHRMEHTDHINSRQRETGVAVIQHHCPRPQIVMYTLGGDFVSKTGNPVCIELPVSVQVLISIPLLRFVTCVIIHIVPRLHILRSNRHRSKAGTHDPGFLIFDFQIETISRVAVTHIVVTVDAQCDNQNQERDPYNLYYLHLRCLSFLCNSNRGR
ncbi:hypothetical protein SDC9_165046 [bioreactor metagenome]|uniref:Uncharacterized protein n=1 Tax=bioreactor metagenome TaxID=1076179 RepID=A0A645FTB4_9ZZZZ